MLVAFLICLFNVVQRKILFPESIVAKGKSYLQLEVEQG